MTCDIGSPVNFWAQHSELCDYNRVTEHGLNINRGNKHKVAHVSISKISNINDYYVNILDLDLDLESLLKYKY